MSAGAASYEITVAAGVLDAVGSMAMAAAPSHRYAIITDTTVGPLYADRVARSFHGGDVVTLSIPPGEEHKTRQSWMGLTDQLLALGLGRDSALLALGGGVVGDLAGFVAATYLRGIPFLQIPTTLLAMIDAAIGGKTGVDTPAGKNLVGAFHQPSAVIADPDVLSTLPAAQIRSGLAEAIKHGAIADAGYLGRIDTLLPELLTAPTGEMMRAVIDRSIAIKREVVASDEREQGRRRILNFGHTIGHALESESRFNLLHGEAIAIGMVLEARLGEEMGVTDAGTASELARILGRAELPVERPPGLDSAALFRAMRADKKSRSGGIEVALPSRLGTMWGAGDRESWSSTVDETLLAAILG
ncbi:MAG: 3-dehydroquinate synthase [Gemmatimonadaceae bacterium]